MSNPHPQSGSSDTSGDAWKTTAAVAVTCCISLTLQHYTFSSAGYYQARQLLATLLEAFDVSSVSASQPLVWDMRLEGLLFWILGTVTTYVLIPVIVLKCWLRRPVREMGLEIGPAIRHGHWYLGMLLIMLPAVWLVSFTDAFQAKYPFYNPPDVEDWKTRVLIWELAYACQFIALEFFFRGFLVHSLKRSLGFSSVFLMTVPYCMIHFGKPMAETCGAIIAGIVLGSLSYRFNSIWLGAALHIGVAWTMDFLAF